MVRFGRLLGLFALGCALQAAVKLPALIGDHMVLQQGMPVRIWGSADPGESVKVDFQGQSVSVKAGENGKWAAWLKPLVAAGPLEMTINGTRDQGRAGGRGVAGLRAIQHGVPAADGDQSR